MKLTNVIIKLLQRNVYLIYFKLRGESLLESNELFKSACIFMNADGLMKSVVSSGFIVLYCFVFYVKM